MSTTAFLATISPETKRLILASIAKHYGISEQDAYEEVTDTDAEHPLDYMTGSARDATSVLMQKHGCRA